MMWHCLNDRFGYCEGEPDFKKEPSSVHYPISWDGVTGNKCKLDPATCGNHQTLTESIAAAKGAGK